MPPLADSQRRALGSLGDDLARVFGRRLASLVAYRAAGHDGDTAVHSLALVDTLAFGDLVACLPLIGGWRRRGLAVPLLLEEEEFRRTLDVFPLEYGGILAHHEVIRGRNPFDGIGVDPADVRRACELQAKSHLIHLREGFLETEGDAAAIASLIAASAQPFRSLLRHITRLPVDGAAAGPDEPPTDAAVAQEAERRIGIPAALVRDVLSSVETGQASIADPTALLTRYVAAAERVWEYVDGWR